MATYGEVTRRIRFEMAADRAVEDTVMIDMVYDAMRMVARICVPMTLVTKDVTNDIIRQIDEVNYIRNPVKPSGDANEILDFDDLLISAVIYMACKLISRDKKGDYSVLMRQAINDYNWAVYESIEDGCYVL